MEREWNFELFTQNDQFLAPLAESREHFKNSPNSQKPHWFIEIETFKKQLESFQKKLQQMESHWVNAQIEEKFQKWQNWRLEIQKLMESLQNQIQTIWEHQNQLQQWLVHFRLQVEQWEPHVEQLIQKQQTVLTLYENRLHELQKENQRLADLAQQLKTQVQLYHEELKRLKKA